MDISFHILMLVTYLTIVVLVLIIQRKKLLKYYKEAFKAIGISLVLPLFAVFYTSFFPGSISSGEISAVLWSQGLPIVYILICCFLIYKFKPISPFLIVFFIGETVALIYPYFIYSMIATGNFL